jgi:hypothetical protein
MRTPLRLFFGVVLFNAAACGLMPSSGGPPRDTDDDGALATSVGPYSLTVSGTGFDNHNKQNLVAVLLEDGAPKANARLTTFNGAFALRWYGVLLDGHTYKVSYYNDVNGNGKCDAPPADHVWGAEVAMDNDTVLNVQHSKTFVNTCPDFASLETAAPANPNTPAPANPNTPAPTTFALTVNGTGFQPHQGMPLFLAVVDANNTRVAGPIRQVVPASGAVTFNFPTALVQGRAYTVQYFADLNQNNACDPPAADHAWSVAVPAVTAPVTLPVAHNTTFVNVCAQFAAPLPP